MERRKAQHRCRRAPHGLARAMSSKRAPPCGAPSTLRASAETPPATRGHAQGGEPPNAIRCGVLLKAEDPRRLGTGCGHWRQSQGRRIVGAFAPRPPLRPTPQAASPRSGSGRVNLSLPGGRVRHEPRGRRASLRSQERLRTAPLTNEAIGIYTHVLICQHLANASF